MLHQNSQPAFHVSCDFHFNFLAFNLTLPPKKIYNKGLIWIQKGKIMQNKSLRNKVKIIKKYILFQFTTCYEENIQ